EVKLISNGDSSLGGRWWLLILLTASDLRPIKVIIILILTVLICSPSAFLIRKGCGLRNHLTVSRNFGVSESTIVAVRIGQLEPKIIANSIIIRGTAVAFLPLIRPTKVRPGIA